MGIEIQLQRIERWRRMICDLTSGGFLLFRMMAQASESVH